MEPKPGWAHLTDDDWEQIEMSHRQGIGRNYDDRVRIRDAYLLSRTLPFDDPDANADVQNALAVFVCDERLRPVIEAIDPKAMEQARDALGLTD